MDSRSQDRPFGAATEQAELVIIGGGAAGYFAAVNFAASDFAGPATDEQKRAIILENASRPLGKVKISGGGRCNVTHALFDPAEFVKRYPRGNAELRGAFSRFQARDTVKWFGERGVTLKREGDGRMFPSSDSSQTIIDCLERAARDAGVDVRLMCKASTVEVGSGSHPFRVHYDSRGSSFAIEARKLLLATGSASRGHALAAALGHTIEPCVPSLFTFEVPEPALTELSGVSVQGELRLKVGGKEFTESGPILITHWGLSGPAVIRLSAWAARPLADANYTATLSVNWVGGETHSAVVEAIRAERESSLRKTVYKNPMFSLPKRLWPALLARAEVSETLAWSDMSKLHIDALATQLTRCSLPVSGKGVFKEEFVTCGGVSRREIDFRTMESKRVPGLYFAGEIIDIDGITGGFNFQSAWTTGWIAANAARASL